MSPTSGDGLPQFLRRQSDADIHLVAGRPEGVQSGIGDLFSDKDAMHETILAVGRRPASGIRVNAL